MKGKTVLVMEDEPDIAALIERSLRLKDVRVIFAYSGAEALDIYRASRPDLVLLDIMMPDIDGFEVCRRLREEPEGRTVPVVFLTVRNQPEDLARAQALGVAGYITKPFDPYKLADELERIWKQT